MSVAARRIEQKLDMIAAALRLKSKRLTRPTMEIDRVWYVDVPTVGLIPLLGIEVEARPKVFKYYKGDIQNIQTLGVQGVIILSDADFGNELKETKHRIDAHTEQRKLPIQVWYESRLDQMLRLLHPS